MYRGHRTAKERRIVWLGLAVSGVVHAVVLLFPMEQERIGPAARVDSPASPRQQLAAIEVVRLAVVLEAPRRDSEERPPDEQSASPDMEVAQTSPGPIGPSEALRDEVEPRAASRPLAPRLDDARLWRERADLAASADDMSNERLLVRSRVSDFNERRAHAPRDVAGMSDWSRGEGDRRWGVSPGRLHLGSTTVPTCLNGGANAADCGFGLLPNRRIEHAGWLRTYNEIRTQSARFEVESDLQNRARAIRARRDAERRDSIPDVG